MDEPRSTGLRFTLGETRRPFVCPVCHGHGHREVAGRVECVACAGSGLVWGPPREKE